MSGDTVLVAEGTYRESLSIAAVDVDVCGEGAREACVVEARGRPVLSPPPPPSLLLPLPVSLLYTHSLPP